MVPEQAKKPMIPARLRGIQGDQLNMVMFFWYFVKSDLSSIRCNTHVQWKSHFLQGTRLTRPCLPDHPVGKTYIDGPCGS